MFFLLLFLSYQLLFTFILLLFLSYKLLFFYTITFSFLPIAFYFLDFSFSLTYGLTPMPTRTSNLLLMPPFVSGALIYDVIPIIITLLGVHPIFKARTTAFLISFLFQVDSFVAGASKTQEDV